MDLTRRTRVKSSGLPLRLDTSTTTISLNLANQLARGVQQKTGAANGEVFTSLKQRDAW